MQVLMDPELGLKAFFLISAATILFVNSTPPLRSRLLPYGSRTTSTGPRPDVGAQGQAKVSSTNPVGTLLDRLAAFQVPHSWFTHFYVASVLSSAFWASQFLLRGRVLKSVFSAKPVLGDGLEKGGMGPEQIALSWGLMTLQGGRRLYECIALGKPSQSTMWFVHWLLGIAFYGAMSMAVWVEGIPILRRTEPSLVLVTPGAPSFRTMICLPLFLIASGIQHDCHSYLASLPKYTLPSHPIFQILICPHYFAECLIYLGLAGIAAPAGSWLNGTIFTALVFVVVNLGVTAETSREWYVGKFGAESVKGRWKMIPFVY